MPQVVIGEGPNELLNRLEAAKGLGLMLARVLVLCAKAVDETMKQCAGLERAQLSGWITRQAHHSAGSGGGDLAQGAVQIRRIVNKVRRGKHASPPIMRRQHSRPENRALCTGQGGARARCATLARNASLRPPSAVFILRSAESRRDSSNQLSWRGKEGTAAREAAAGASPSSPVAPGDRHSTSAMRWSIGEANAQRKDERNDQETHRVADAHEILHLDIPRRDGGVGGGHDGGGDGDGLLLNLVLVGLGRARHNAGLVWAAGGLGAGSR